MCNSLRAFKSLNTETATNSDWLVFCAAPKKYWVSSKLDINSNFVVPDGDLKSLLYVPNCSLSALSYLKLGDPDTLSFRIKSANETYCF